MAILKVRPDHDVIVDSDVYDQLTLYNWRLDPQGRVIAWSPISQRMVTLLKTVWELKADKPYSKQVQRVDKATLDYRICNLCDVKTQLISIDGEVATLKFDSKRFTVDAKYADVVAQYNWRDCGKGYLRTGYYNDPEQKDAYIPLHHFVYFLEHGVVLGKGDGQIDHVDRNPANNTVDNLRYLVKPVTPQ